MPLSNQTFAAIDTGLFQELGELVRKLGEYRKHEGGPVLVMDEPWEQANEHCWGQIEKDPRSALYHLWYSCTRWKEDGGAEHDHVCYAYSRDGLRWSKPNLGKALHGGSSDNNIISEDFLGILGSFEDFHDPDPQRRFKRPYAKNADTTPQDCPHHARGLHFAVSPDRKNWQDTPESPIKLQRGIADTFNHGFWDPDLEKYVIITRTHKAIPGSDQIVRSVGRIDSPDFINWSPLETVFLDKEPGETVRQYYSMPTFKYAGGYVGLLYVFHSDPGGNPEGDTPIDIELAWSPDSIHWEEISHGQPLIERGEEGQFDHGRIFGLWSPHGLIEQPQELRLYYGGSSIGKELIFKKPMSRGIGLATFRKDGLVYLETPSNETVTAKTRTLRLDGRFLVLNANASNGRIRIGIEDLLGAPIRGFSVEDCNPLEADATSHVVSWNHNSDLSTLKNRHIRLVLEMQNTRFYSVNYISSSRPEDQHFKK
ncbi:MAG: hypothetical protein QF473_34465 [Planctomycetota bacterium]|jgi:hypothetical protein|nr:hypothetical protein [Planctomycetota bacterium]